MTPLQMYRRLRDLDYQIEAEEYECEGNPASDKLRLLRAERKMIGKQLSDFYDDPITQSISL